MVYVFIALSLAASGLIGYYSGWFLSWNALWQIPLTSAGFFFGFQLFLIFAFFLLALFFLLLEALFVVTFLLLAEFFALSIRKSCWKSRAPTSAL